MKCHQHAETEAVGTCTRCGKAICSDCTLNINGKMVCKQCAEQMASAPAINRKEPILSLVLSFLIPGVGQIYNGQVKKGLILLVVYFLLCWTCLIPLLIWIYGMYDGYTVAQAINRGECLPDWLS